MTLIQSQANKPTSVALLLHEDVAGFAGDPRPVHEDIVGIISILENAGIPCCFVNEYALIYYGAGRKQNDRVLCVPDHQHQNAADLFTLHSDTLIPWRPSPMRGRIILLQAFPRFKATKSAGFWVLVTASFAHIPCEPGNIEKSKGHLPYPSLAVYAQSLLDTQNDVDLEDLVDGMNLSEEWGKQHLDLDKDTDVQWARRQIAVYKEAGIDEMFVSLDTEPRKTRVDWQRVSRNNEARIGIKKSAALYATRFRRHGSKDPRSVRRNLI